MRVRYQEKETGPKSTDLLKLVLGMQIGKKTSKPAHCWLLFRLLFNLYFISFSNIRDVFRPFIPLYRCLKQRKGMVKQNQEKKYPNSKHMHRLIR